MTTRWTNLPSSLTRAANRLERHRYALFIALGATWVALAALVFTTHTTVSHQRGVALAIAIALALVVNWVLFLWAWFRGAAVSYAGTRAQAVIWFRVVLLLVFGIIVIFMLGTMATLFLRL